MDLNALQTFVAVVRAGGFAAAARKTDTPRSSVSLRIRNLEKSLGVRLFKRSTRAFALTAEGQDLYDRAAQSLTSLVDAVANTMRSGGEYAGEIRMTLPADFPTIIVANAIAQFRSEHPAVRFGVILSNSVLDMVSENIDLALRIGASNPQGAVIRGVLDVEFGLFASVDYLDRFGEPSTLHDIPTLIGPQRAELRRLLSLFLPGSEELLKFDIAADSFSFIRDLVTLNQGVGLLPKAMCQAELRSGAIVPVLRDHWKGAVRLYLTYPSRADLNPKVREFARTLVSHLEAAYFS
jgi:DNA-binding transcriptional LysR family regulator